MKTQNSTSPGNGAVSKLGEAESQLRILSKEKPRLMKIFSALALGALNSDYIAGMLPSEALFEVQQRVAPKPTEESFRRALKSLALQGLIRTDVLISLDDTSERGILPTHVAQLAWEKLRGDSAIVLVDIPSTLRGFRERLSELPPLNSDAKRALRILAVAHRSGQSLGLSAAEIAEQIKTADPDSYPNGWKIGQLFRSDMHNSPLFIPGSELVRNRPPPGVLATYARVSYPCASPIKEEQDEQTTTH